MSKRGAVSELLRKTAKTNSKVASNRAEFEKEHQRNSNPYLSQPTHPESALQIFLLQARNEVRRQMSGSDGSKLPFEIEARLGIFNSSFGARAMRVAPSGPKQVSMQGKTSVANAFVVNPEEGAARVVSAQFEGGITRTHYVNWTMAGLSESSPISSAFGLGAHPDAATIKKSLQEFESVETVFAGYAGSNNRICFPGESRSNRPGRMELKERLCKMDVALVSAPYDMRIQLATEKLIDDQVRDPPPGWTTKRLKRRRSYQRKEFAWRLDVTEVTTTPTTNGSSGHSKREDQVAFEIELELNEKTMMKLVHEQDDAAAKKLCADLSKQLWWMLNQINPTSEVLEVDEYLQDHPLPREILLAKAMCGSLKRLMGGKGAPAVDPQEAVHSWHAPFPDSEHETDDAVISKASGLANMPFMGCMPVNFSRHHIETVQRSADNAYFLSEKTDGVRHLLVVTPSSVVLVDRAMKGKRPKSSGGEDPFAFLHEHCNVGTVLDGEVVMHRKLRRPIFIVFDVLVLNVGQPVLHLPFEQRLHHLRRASFQKESSRANKVDLFDPSFVKNTAVPLPLVRKNFVKRTLVQELLSKVTEERGLRSYKNGELHQHLTDGIIFQPNLPYACGTDMNLLKWKYLDTVTIDVEIMPPKYHHHSHNDNDNEEQPLRVGVLGDEGTMVDMSRYVHLPPSECRRLEADRQETQAKIVEVGFDATTGEWYYLTTRPDKVAPNHISTVLGTLLELAEALTTEELQYRMSVPPGQRDTFRKDIRGMQKQLLDHQQRKLRQQHSSSSSSSAGR